MRARGGAQDGSHGGSSSSPISAGWVSVEGAGAPSGAAAGMNMNMNVSPEAKEEDDVPDTVDYNGEVSREVLQQ